MVNQWISVLGQSLPMPIFAYALDTIHEIRPNGVKRWMRIAFGLAVYMSMAVSKVFSNGSVAGSIRGWCIFIGYTVFAFRFFYGGSLRRKIWVHILLCGGLLSAECAFELVLLLFHVEGLSMDFTQPDMAVGCVLGGLCSIVVLSVMLSLWKRLSKKTRIFRSSWVLVLMGGCLCVPTCCYYFDLMNNDGAIQQIIVLSMAAAAVLDVLLICIQFNQAEKDNIEWELRSLKHQAELERQHYRNVEDRREELDKLRQDYDGLLTSVRRLLDGNQSDQAERTLMALLSRVEQTREYPYCGIPIVNAVLSEKQRLCDQEGIRLETDMLFSDKIAVEQLDLCSIFGNLMDNAIRACSRLDVGFQRVITLNAGMQGDYLLIRCDNPAGTSGTYPTGTGYGTKILKEIAERYDGSFHTELHDGVFTARMVLLAMPISLEKLPFSSIPPAVSHK